MHYASWSNKAIRAAAVAVASALVLAVSACGSSQAGATAKEPSNGVVNVVASINQWGSVASDLGGDKVKVTSVMSNTNVEAHDYEPTTSDISTISSADVIVVNGADYDSWASKAAGSTKAIVVNAATTGGKKSGDNPHVWFSASVRKATADAITKAYERALPVQKDYFSTRNSQWHDRERAVEKNIADARRTTENTPYAATESVAWYLADDLGMKDSTPAGYAQASANESEPSASDILAFTKALSAGSIKLLIFNSQEADSVTNTITDAAKQSQVPMVTLTEQMPKQYTNLLDWMDALTASFAKELAQR